MRSFSQTPGPPVLLLPLLLLAVAPATSSPTARPVQAFASPLSALSLSSCLPFSRRRAPSPVSHTPTACEPPPSPPPPAAPTKAGDEEGLNFRDLAGAGGACAPGRVFRTANLMAPYVPEGASGRVFASRSIGCVLDLRSEDETRTDTPHPYAATYRFRRGAPEPPLAAGAVGAEARYVVPMLERGPIFEGVIKRATLQEKMSLLFWGLFDGDRQQRVFIDKMNEGGLLALSEIILDECKPEVSYALRVVAAHLEKGVPVAFQCRLGKDRTGIVAALLLLALGAPEERVVEDYVKSHGSDQIALGAVQREAERSKKKGPRLDRNVFQGARAETMQGILTHLRGEYGGVEGYLDAIGLGEDWRARLREAGSL